MHHGKLTNLPGAWTASPNLRYHVTLMKSLMAAFIIAGNDSLIRPHCVETKRTALGVTINTGSGPGAI